MAFCVNCGSEYVDDDVYICRTCYKDPRVPHSRWEAALEELEADDEVEYHDFSYHHEKLSLVVAILISSVIIFLFSAATVGLVLLGILIAVIYFRITWIQTKASLMQVTKEHYTEIYSMAQVAAGRLRIPMPPIYIRQNPIPNAFTSGLFNENFIVLHSGILDLLAREELLSVIGHEMGHIKQGHVTWLILTNPGRTTTVPVLSLVLKPIFNNWHLRSEYTADRAGLLASGELKHCLLTEVKLMAGKELPTDFDLDKYIDDIEHEDIPTEDSVLETLFRQHPYARNRIRQMRSFFDSTTYRRIWSEFSVP